MRVDRQDVVRRVLGGLKMYPGCAAESKMNLPLIFSGLFLFFVCAAVCYLLKNLTVAFGMPS